MATRPHPLVPQVGCDCQHVLYDTYMEFEQNGCIYLDKIFMNAIFDGICFDNVGNPAPLPILKEAIKYQ